MGREFRSCRRAVAVVAALSALLGAPPAASALSIGEGDQPGLAVDAAGTAYIAWNGPSASLQFCRLPRGATACDIRFAIPAAGASIRRPFVSTEFDLVSILQYRYPLQNGDPAAGLFSFYSSDRGATFDPALRVGTLDMYDGVFGGDGHTVSGVTDSSAQGGAFQNVYPYAAPPNPFAPPAQLWGGDHPYSGSVALVDAATPLVIFSDGSGAAQFRRYSGTGDLNDAANWTPAVDIGTVRYPHLASGPSGLFLVTTNPDNTLVSRKWDGTTFGADVAISAGASAPSVHAFEDAGGRLHVVFQRGGTEGTDLIHAVSDDGITWRSGIATTTAELVDSFGDTRVATAADHIGVVVWRGVAGIGVAADIRVAAVGPDAPVAPDTTPPETEIKKGPKKVTTSKPKATVKFTFTSSEPGSTFECRLDKKPFKPCSSPQKVKVKPGRHRFTVIAIDAAGNPDPSPVTFKFKVVRK